MWIIDQAWGQDGCILVMLFCASLTKSRSINTPQNEHDQFLERLTEQAWSIKDVLYGIKKIISLVEHSAQYDLSCPLKIQTI